MLSLQGEYDIRIFVHQKGQLLKNLGLPHFALDNGFLKKEKKRFKSGFKYKIDLYANAVDVLHKRQDSVRPCNDKLHNEDAVWIQNAIRLLNCTPSFLKPAKSILGMNEIPLSHEACNKENLFKFHSQYAPESNFDSVARFYEHPCREMESIVTSSATSIPNSERSILVSGDLAVGSSNKVSDLEIKLHYRTQHYKLSSNEKSFTLLSLWSEIGGFIGMFLGYSLLQFPELLGNLCLIADYCNHLPSKFILCSE